MSNNSLDKGERVSEKVAASFSLAAATYDRHAVLQKNTGDWLLEAADCSGLKVLDLGCGTGMLGVGVRRMAPEVLYGLDLSCAFLEKSYQCGCYDELVNADMSLIPMGSESVDLVLSNLAVQWAPDPGSVLREVGRILKPGGTFCFTVPLPGSLIEIERAWASVGDRSSHINSFNSQETWEKLGKSEGFRVEFEEQEWVRWFESPKDAVRSLKRVGANKVVSGGKSGLTGKSAYAEMFSHYEKMRQKQGIPLTYRILRAKMYV